VTVDLLGYAFGIALAAVLVWFAMRERRWWSWLQLAGIAVLTVVALAGGSLPGAVEQAARLTGPPLLVLGLLAWRLHWDAGWFGGDDLRPPERPPRRDAADGGEDET
jgi:hypothetical protein